METLNPGLGYNPTPPITPGSVRLGKNLASQFGQLQNTSNVFTTDASGFSLQDAGSYDTNFDPFEVQQYNRSHNQGAINKLANGAVNFVGKTLINIASTPTSVGGAVIGGFNPDDSFVNGAVQGATVFQPALEMLEKAFPVYAGQKYTEGNFLDRLGTVDFLAKDFADGAAFLASAYFSGQAVSKLFTVAGSAMSASSKVGAAAARVNTFLKGAGVTATELGTTAVNTIYEAGMEAYETGKQIDSVYEVKIDNARRSGDVDAVKFLELERDTRKDAAQASTFNYNVILLGLGTNLIESKWLLGSTSVNQQAIKSAYRNAVIANGGKVLTAAEFAGVNGNILKTIGKGIAKGTLTEAIIEENYQAAVQELQNRKYIQNIDTNSSLGSDLVYLAKGMASNIKGYAGNVASLGTLRYFGDSLETQAGTPEDDASAAMFIATGLGGGMSAAHNLRQEKERGAAYKSIAEYYNSKLNYRNKVDELLIDNVKSPLKEFDIKEESNNLPQSKESFVDDVMASFDGSGLTEDQLLAERAKAEAAYDIQAKKTAETKPGLGGKTVINPVTGKAELSAVKIAQGMRQLMYKKAQFDLNYTLAEDNDVLSAERNVGEALLAHVWHNGKQGLDSEDLRFIYDVKFSSERGKELGINEEFFQERKDLVNKYIDIFEQVQKEFYDSSQFEVGTVNSMIANQKAKMAFFAKASVTSIEQALKRSNEHFSTNEVLDFSGEKLIESGDLGNNILSDYQALINTHLENYSGLKDSNSEINQIIREEIEPSMKFDAEENRITDEMKTIENDPNLDNDEKELKKAGLVTQRAVNAYRKSEFMSSYNLGAEVFEYEEAPGNKYLNYYDSARMPSGEARKDLAVIRDLSKGDKEEYQFKLDPSQASAIVQSHLIQSGFLKLIKDKVQEIRDKRNTKPASEILMDLMDALKLTVYPQSLENILTKDFLDLIDFVEQELNDLDLETTKNINFIFDKFNFLVQEALNTKDSGIIYDDNIGMFSIQDSIEDFEKSLKDRGITNPEYQDAINVFKLTIDKLDDIISGTPPVTWEQSIPALMAQPYADGLSFENIRQKYNNDFNKASEIQDFVRSIKQRDADDVKFYVDSNERIERIPFTTLSGKVFDQIFGNEIAIKNAFQKNINEGTSDDNLSSFKDVARVGKSLEYLNIAKIAYENRDDFGDSADAKAFVKDQLKKIDGLINFYEKFLTVVVKNSLQSQAKDSLYYQVKGKSMLSSLGIKVDPTTGEGDISSSAAQVVQSILSNDSRNLIDEYKFLQGQQFSLYSVRLFVDNLMASATDEQIKELKDAIKVNADTYLTGIENLPGVTDSRFKSFKTNPIRSVREILLYTQFENSEPPVYTTMQGDDNHPASIYEKNQDVLEYYFNLQSYSKNKTLSNSLTFLEDLYFPLTASLTTLDLLDRPDKAKYSLIDAVTYINKIAYEDNKIALSQQQLTTVLDLLDFIASPTQTSSFFKNGLYLNGVLGSGKSILMGYAYQVAKKMGLASDETTLALGHVDDSTKAINDKLFGVGTRTSSFKDTLAMVDSKTKLLIVDEAPALSSPMLLNINKGTTDNNIKVIYVGDLSQIPGDSDTPRLNISGFSPGLKLATPLSIIYRTTINAIASAALEFKGKSKSIETVSSQSLNANGIYNPTNDNIGVNQLSREKILDIIANSNPKNLSRVVILNNDTEVLGFKNQLAATKKITLQELENQLAADPKLAIRSALDAQGKTVDEAFILLDRNLPDHAGALNDALKYNTLLYTSIGRATTYVGIAPSAVLVNSAVTPSISKELDRGDQLKPVEEAYNKVMLDFEAARTRYFSKVNKPATTTTVTVNPNKPAEPGIEIEAETPIVNPSEEKTIITEQVEEQSEEEEDDDEDELELILQPENKGSDIPASEVFDPSDELYNGSISDVLNKGEGIPLKFPTNNVVRDLLLSLKQNKDLNTDLKIVAIENKTVPGGASFFVVWEKQIGNTKTHKVVAVIGAKDFSNPEIASLINGIDLDDPKNAIKVIKNNARAYLDNIDGDIPFIDGINNRSFSTLKLTSANKLTYAYDYTKPLQSDVEQTLNVFALNIINDTNLKEISWFKDGAVDLKKGFESGDLEFVKVTNTTLQEIKNSGTKSFEPKVGSFVLKINNLFSNSAKSEYIIYQSRFIGESPQDYELSIKPVKNLYNDVVRLEEALTSIPSMTMGTKEFNKLVSEYGKKTLSYNNVTDTITSTPIEDSSKAEELKQLLSLVPGLDKIVLSTIVPILDRIVMGVFGVVEEATTFDLENEDDVAILNKLYPESSKDTSTGFKRIGVFGKTIKNEAGVDTKRFVKVAKINEATGESKYIRSKQVYMGKGPAAVAFKNLTRGIKSQYFNGHNIFTVSPRTVKTASGGSNIAWAKVPRALFTTSTPKDKFYHKERRSKYLEVIEKHKLDTGQDLLTMYHDPKKYSGSYRMKYQHRKFAASTDNLALTIKAHVPQGIEKLIEIENEVSAEKSGTVTSAALAAFGAMQPGDVFVNNVADESGQIKQEKIFYHISALAAHNAQTAAVRDKKGEDLASFIDKNFRTGFDGLQQTELRVQLEQVDSKKFAEKAEEEVSKDDEATQIQVFKAIEQSTPYTYEEVKAIVEKAIPNAKIVETILKQLAEKNMLVNKHPTMSFNLNVVPAFIDTYSKINNKLPSWAGATSVVVSTPEHLIHELYHGITTAALYAPITKEELQFKERIQALQTIYNFHYLKEAVGTTIRVYIHEKASNTDGIYTVTIDSINEQQKTVHFTYNNKKTSLKLGGNTVMSPLGAYTNPVTGLITQSGLEATEFVGHMGNPYFIENAKNIVVNGESLFKQIIKSILKFLGITQSNVYDLTLASIENYYDQISPLPLNPVEDLSADLPPIIEQAVENQLEETKKKSKKKEKEVQEGTAPVELTTDIAEQVTKDLEKILAFFENEQNAEKIFDDVSMADYVYALVEEAERIGSGEVTTVDTYMTLKNSLKAYLRTKYNIAEQNINFQQFKDKTSQAVIDELELTPPGSKYSKEFRNVIANAFSNKIKLNVSGGSSILSPTISERTFSNPSLVRTIIRDTLLHNVKVNNPSQYASLFYKSKGGVTYDTAKIINEVADDIMKFYQTDEQFINFSNKTERQVLAKDIYTILKMMSNPSINKAVQTFVKDERVNMNNSKASALRVKKLTAGTEFNTGKAISSAMHEVKKILYDNYSIANRDNELFFRLKGDTITRNVNGQLVQQSIALPMSKIEAIDYTFKTLKERGVKPYVTKLARALNSVKNIGLLQKYNLENLNYNPKVVSSETSPIDILTTTITRIEIDLATLQSQVEQTPQIVKEIKELTSFKLELVVAYNAYAHTISGITTLLTPDVNGSTSIFDYTSFKFLMDKIFSDFDENVYKILGDQEEKAASLINEIQENDSISYKKSLTESVKELLSLVPLFREDGFGGMTIKEFVKPSHAMNALIVLLDEHFDISDLTNVETQLQRAILLNRKSPVKLAVINYVLRPLLNARNLSQSFDKNSREGDENSNRKLLSSQYTISIDTIGKDSRGRLKASDPIISFIMHPENVDVVGMSVAEAITAGALYTSVRASNLASLTENVSRLFTEADISPEIFTSQDLADPTNDGTLAALYTIAEANNLITDLVPLASRSKVNFFKGSIQPRDSGGFYTNYFEINKSIRNQKYNNVIKNVLFQLITNNLQHAGISNLGFDSSEIKGIYLDLKNPVKDDIRNFNAIKKFYSILGYGDRKDLINEITTYKGAEGFNDQQLAKSFIDSTGGYIKDLLDGFYQVKTSGTFSDLTIDQKTSTLESVTSNQGNSIKGITEILRSVDRSEDELSIISGDNNRVYTMQRRSTAVTILKALFDRVEKDGKSNLEMYDNPYYSKYNIFMNGVSKASYSGARHDSIASQYEKISTKDMNEGQQLGLQFRGYFLDTIQASEAKTNLTYLQKLWQLGESTKPDLVSVRLLPEQDIRKSLHYMILQYQNTESTYKMSKARYKQGRDSFLGFEELQQALDKFEQERKEGKWKTLKDYEKNDKVVDFIMDIFVEKTLANLEVLQKYPEVFSEDVYKRMHIFVSKLGDKQVVDLERLNKVIKRKTGIDYEVNVVSEEKKDIEFKSTKFEGKVPKTILPDMSYLLPALHSFTMNRYVNSNNLTQLIMGDFLEYGTMDNLNKRGQLFMSPGDVGRIDDKWGLPQQSKVLILKDLLLNKLDITSFINSFSEDFGDLTEVEAEEIINLFPGKSEVTDGFSLVSDRYFNKLVKSYGSGLSLGNIMKNQYAGPATKKIFEPALFIKEGRDLNKYLEEHKKDSKNKNIDLRPDYKLTGEFMPYELDGVKGFIPQIEVVEFVGLKNSLVHISPKMKENNKALAALADFIDGYVKNPEGELVEHGYGTVDILTFSSGNKLSEPTGETIELALESNDSEEIDNQVSGISEAMFVNNLRIIDNRFYKMQFNPVSESTSTAIPRQLTAFTRAMDKNPEAAAKIHNALSAIIFSNYSKVKKQLGNPQNFLTSNIKETSDNAFVKNLLDVGIPFNHPMLEAKSIGIFNSLFNSNISRIEMNGGKLILQSPVGAKNPQTGEKLKYYKDPKTGMPIAEAIIHRKFLNPEVVKQIEENLRTKGSKEIYITPSTLGFRIPSSEKNAAVALKIVGFYDDSADTNVAILPEMLIPIQGWDFDIDSLFIINRDLFKKDISIPYGLTVTKDKPVGYVFKNGQYIENFAAFEQELLNNVKEVKDTIVNLRANANPTSKEQIKVNKKILDDLEEVRIKLYKNIILEGYMEVMINPTNIKEVVTPISTKYFSDTLELFKSLGLDNYTELTSLGDFKNDFKAYAAYGTAANNIGIYANKTNVDTSLTGIPLTIPEQIQDTKTNSKSGYKIIIDGIPVTKFSNYIDFFGKQMTTYQLNSGALNGYLDYIKDAILGKINLDGKAGAMMSSLIGIEGLSWEFLAHLFNHPYAKDYISTLNTRVGRAAEKKLFESTKEHNVTLTLDDLIDSHMLLSKNKKPTAKELQDFLKENPDRFEAIEKSIISLLRFSTQLSNNYIKLQTFFKLPQQINANTKAEIDDTMSNLNSILKLRKEVSEFKPIQYNDTLDHKENIRLLVENMASQVEFDLESPVLAFGEIVQGEEKEDYTLEILKRNPHAVAAYSAIKTLDSLITDNYKMYSKFMQRGIRGIKTTQFDLKEKRNEQDEISREHSDWLLSSMYVDEYKGLKVHLFDNATAEGAEAVPTVTMMQIKAIAEYERELVRENQNYTVNEFIDKLILPEDSKATRAKISLVNGTSIDPSELPDYYSAFKRLNIYKLIPVMSKDRIISYRVDLDPNGKMEDINAFQKLLIDNLFVMGVSAQKTTSYLRLIPPSFMIKRYPNYKDLFESLKIFNNKAELLQEGENAVYPYNEAFAMYYGNINRDAIETYPLTNSIYADNELIPQVVKDIIEKDTDIPYHDKAYFFPYTADVKNGERVPEQGPKNLLSPMGSRYTSKTSKFKYKDKIMLHTGTKKVNEGVIYFYSEIPQTYAKIKTPPVLEGKPYVPQDYYKTDMPTIFNAGLMNSIKDIEGTGEYLRIEGGTVKNSVTKLLMENQATNVYLVDTSDIYRQTIIKATLVSYDKGTNNFFFKVNEVSTVQDRISDSPAINFQDNTPLTDYSDIITRANSTQVIEEAKELEKNCKGFNGISAKHGVSLSFTPGSKWNVVKDLKGYPSHSQGGVDLKFGSGGVMFTNQNGKQIKAANGLVLSGVPVAEPVFQANPTSLETNPVEIVAEAPQWLKDERKNAMTGVPTLSRSFTVEDKAAPTNTSKPVVSLSSKDIKANVREHSIEEIKKLGSYEHSNIDKIKKLQNDLNVNYGANLTPDGILGIKTMNAYKIHVMNDKNQSQEYTDYLETLKVKQDYQNKVAEYGKQFDGGFKKDFGLDPEIMSKLQSYGIKEPAQCIGGICTKLKEQFGNDFMPETAIKSGQGVEKGIYYSNRAFEKDVAKNGFQVVQKLGKTDKPQVGDILNLSYNPQSFYENQFEDDLENDYKTPKSRKARYYKDVKDDKFSQHSYLVIGGDENYTKVLHNGGKNKGEVKLISTKRIVNTMGSLQEDYNPKGVYRIFRKNEYGGKDLGKLYRESLINNQEAMSEIAGKYDIRRDNYERKTESFDNGYVSQKQVTQIKKETSNNPKMTEYIKGINEYLESDANNKEISTVSPEHMGILARIAATLPKVESEEGQGVIQNLENILPDPLIKIARKLSDTGRGSKRTYKSSLSKGLTQINPDFVDPKIASKLNISKKGISDILEKNPKAEADLVMNKMIELYHMVESNPNLYNNNPNKFWPALIQAWKNPSTALSFKGKEYLSQDELDYANSILSNLKEVQAEEFVK